MSCYDDIRAKLGPAYVGETRPAAHYLLPPTKRDLLTAYWRASARRYVDQPVFLKTVFSYYKDIHNITTLSYKEQKVLVGVIEELRSDGWIIRLDDKEPKRPTVECSPRDQTTLEERSAAPTDRPIDQPPIKRKRGRPRKVPQES